MAEMTAAERRQREGSLMQSAGPLTTSDKVTFFDLEAMPVLPVMTEDTADPESAMIKIQAPVNHSDPSGYSLLCVRYAPGAVVPRHRHDVAQVVLVLDGELWQGNRRFGPGAGYFTPAGSAYTVKAGPEGVRLVEFRHSPLTFETEWVGDAPSQLSD
ncbi:MAG TPA: cupin domain-containing protein [Acidimicrobiales bacterium]|nr:cupin domain-containing protein [Acidimicrobiales bacterium]